MRNKIAIGVVFALAVCVVLALLFKDARWVYIGGAFGVFFFVLAGLDFLTRKADKAPSDTFHFGSLILIALLLVLLGYLCVIYPSVVYSWPVEYCKQHDNTQTHPFDPDPAPRAL
jgi:heme O synthase-like polyprenyltransferase